MNNQHSVQIGNGNLNNQVYALGKYERPKEKEPWFKKEVVKTVLWILGTLIVAGILAYLGLKG